MGPSVGSTVAVQLEHLLVLKKYTDVASISMLVFEYSLMLDLEIKHIWRAKWTITTLVFLFIRYLPFVESAILLYRTFSFNLTVDACNTTYRTSTVSILIGVISAEIVLSIRTWAVWKQSRRIGIGLIVFSIVIAVSGISVMTIFSRTVKFIEPPYQPYRGCFLYSGSRILSVVWIDLMIYDGCLLALMVLSVRIWTEPNLKSLFMISDCDNELFGSVLREGVMYYLYLFVLSAINVALIFIMPPDFVNLLTMTERVIHSLLTCRIILHIKQSAVADTETLPTTVTALEFVHSEQED
ncbi:hypothetical protein BDQ17DRAFT_1429196 [Cyathus striatus]|nr:hypothetical protein BDQ17DRAFT_1429196 [Cyathus striatus]